MSRSELVRLSGVSKQQLSRLENGLIRLRLDHLKPFAGALGYTPEQILLWGRYPGTGGAAAPLASCVIVVVPVTETDDEGLDQRSVIVAETIVACTPPPICTAVR